MNKIINESQKAQWKKVILAESANISPDRLEWMSEMAVNHQYNEDGTIPMKYDNLPMNLYESAQGGVSFPYATLHNTNGIGNPTLPSLVGQSGASQTDPRTMGSGDKWNTTLPIALQVAGRTIGFDVVNVLPTSGPNGVIPYMDYIYGTGKDIYGATPGHDENSINPGADIHKRATTVLTFKLPMSGVDAAKLTHGAEVKFTNSTVEVTATFVSLGRLDGYPIFRVRSFNPTASNLADVFNKDGVVGTITGVDAGSNKANEVTATARPMAVSALEDHIQGYTGAGETDSNEFNGTFVDGMEIYDPMDRGTGENAYARTMSLKLFTKSFTVGTTQVSVSGTQEQIQDLKRQFAIDAIKMLIESGINELSQEINKQICSRLFGLGWKNHIRANRAEGINLNIDLNKQSNTEPTPAYAYLDNGKQLKESMPVAGIKFGGEGTTPLANIDVISKYVATYILAAKNIVAHRGRRGEANFCIINTKIATLLQQGKNYQFAPFENQISTDSLYQMGKIGGMTIYVDPNMKYNDTRILVGKKAGLKDPGLFFCPYIMAESVQIITEGTMAPKCQIKSRYQLVEAGFHPETMYFTMLIRTSEGIF